MWESVRRVMDFDYLKHQEDNVVSSESVNGGVDVWDDSKVSKNEADHLVVMVNGIMGSSTDWKFGAEQFVRMLPNKVFVHCSESNTSVLTLDGIDVMGERLAQEVIEVIRQTPGLKKISFVAHSMGGLVSRYAIGRLYRASPRTENIGVEDVADGDPRGTIFGLKPMNFITVATPHLGSRGNNQVPFLFGVTALEKAASLVCHWIFRTTGKHLFLTDSEDGKPPLLRCMVNDYGHLYFISALRAFKRRVVYANVGYDHIVGWRTSSIRRKSELPEWEDSLSAKYPHIVHEEKCKELDSQKCDLISLDSESFEAIEDELLTGLSRVSWEKVDVSFHTTRQRFAAHNVIQVKDQFMHSEGADVIQHIIDHFQV